MFEQMCVRVIVQERGNAASNMATDEALLSCFNEGDLPVLRVYHWTQSFTIGTAQDVGEYDFRAAFCGDYAKRITGGGVLFHGHDLSYALVVPSIHVNTFSIKQSYEKLGSFLLYFYEKLGLKACYAKDLPELRLSKNPFCQVGFEAYDMLVNGVKMGGNAQRRTKKAVFQHGSIPLFRPQNPLISQEKFGMSLEDLGLHVSFKETTAVLVQAFEECFSATLVPSTLSQSELAKKQRLMEEKYNHARG